MPRPRFSQHERKVLCDEARRRLRANVKFSDICASLQLNQQTLRKWLNDEAFDWVYPKVPNQGHMP